MKKILITGANSYIGTSLDKWLNQWPDQYIVHTIDMLDPSWKEKDFSHYDVVFHVAGIAHADTNKVNRETQELYYRVNRDLTKETAKKSKKDGVKQFIFMSSIIVYGDSSPIGKARVITRETVPEPSNFYGDSKLQAEKGIIPLQSDDFNVVILRPPMIYGNGSKGNYPKLVSYAKKLPVFPNIKNKRSMLHIDNLCEFIRLMIDNEEKGFFFPQNKEYVNTSEMVKLIAEVHGKKILLTQVFNPAIHLLGIFIRIINKAFGSLVYEECLSNYKDDYRIRNLVDSIRITERK